MDYMYNICKLLHIVSNDPKLMLVVNNYYTATSGGLIQNQGYVVSHKSND